MEIRQAEHNKIRQIAKNYQENGYKVIIEPRGFDIPEFIENYQPDIIASNEKETVVIEIKMRSDFSTIDRLRDVADAINKKENWRFELIVTGIKQENKTDNDKSNIDLDISEIEKSIKEVKIIVKQGLYSAAFILCWANLESLSRQLLLDDKKNLKNKTPLVLIKTLFAFGYLNRTEYESLKKLFMLRNQIVHGYKAINLDLKSVERLIKITESLIREKQKI
jgi:uncharacterized protein YutE (UPF0331/DUF86 family)